MKKTIILTSALVPLLFAIGCGDSAKTPDAAIVADTAVKSDTKPALVDAPAADTAKNTDTALPTDTSASDAMDASTVDGLTADASTVDASTADAPATVADGNPAGDAGDARPDDASGCTPSLPIVHVTQSIAAATTWTTGKVYVIDQSIAIGAILTIEPGVVVKFEKGPMFTIGQGGGIVADGKSANSAIVFTSIKDDAHGGDSNGDCSATKPAPGDWASIKISHDNSKLNYCQFLYGGSAKPYSGALSVINDATATISNCTFAYNDGGELDDNRAAALNVGSSAAATQVTGNTFYGNVIPLVINGFVNLDNSNVFRSQPATVDAGTVVTNTYNGIFMDGASHGVSGAVTWSNITVPYVLYETTLSVYDNGVLTLADGVVVKSYKNRIDVANLGTLIPGTTTGTGAVFTSFNDDSKLGDTNGDGPATTAVKGDWVGVNICKPLCSAATWGTILYASNF